ncbi:hypothetical protein J0S82_009295, partial [Galemys pyrenaicus]
CCLNKGHKVTKNVSKLRQSCPQGHTTFVQGVTRKSPSTSGLHIHHKNGGGRLGETYIHPRGREKS